MSHNLEKSRVHKGVYTGYSGRLRWSIKKHGGKWLAFSRDERTGESHSLNAATLQGMSALLEEYEAPKKNPAKKKTPAKRLKARRKANTVPGYYPNPSEVAAAYKTPAVKKETHPFHVQKETATDQWETVGKFATAADAMSYARSYAKKTTKPIRAVKV